MPPEPGAVTVPAPTRRHRATRLVAVLVLAVLGVLAVAPASAGASRGAAPTAAQGTVASAAARWQAPGGGAGEQGEPDDDSLPVPEPSTEDADRRAQEILDDPKFDEPEPGLVERFFRWIGEQLDKLQLPGLGGAGVGGSQIVGWLFIAVLIGLAIFLVSKIRLSRRPGRDDPAFVVDAEISRTQTEWLAEAERFEAEGQWKQALRCRFRALVSALIDRGVVRDIPGRTTGEYRVEVTRNAPFAAPSFAGAAELFDRAWYGDEPTGPEESARFRGLADDLVQRLDAPPTDPVLAAAGPAGAGQGRP